MKYRTIKTLVFKNSVIYRNYIKAIGTQLFILYLET